MHAYAFRITKLVVTLTVRQRQLNRLNFTRFDSFKWLQNYIDFLRNDKNVYFTQKVITETIEYVRIIIKHLALLTATELFLKFSGIKVVNL